VDYIPSSLSSAYDSFAKLTSLDNSSQSAAAASSATAGGGGGAMNARSIAKSDSSGRRKSRNTSHIGRNAASSSWHPQAPSLVSWP